MFKKGRQILYVGKATSLKDRVKSYFGDDLIATRGPMLVDMVTKAKKVDFIETMAVYESQRAGGSQSDGFLWACVE